MTATVLTSLKRKEFYAAIFLDIAQTFDRVWHDGLAIKIAPIFPNNVCTLLRDYLSNRTFFVVYGDSTSTTRPITAGVPQGSVLGPLLYALYTVDLSETADTVHATFIDTALLSSSADYSEAVFHLQEALNAFLT